MPIEIYFYLLIICGVWFQGITGIVGDEEIRETSDIHIRQKRVLNRIPGEDKKTSIHLVPYIVRIKENRRINCLGSIVSHRIVITIAACVMYEAPQYHIMSGAAYLTKGFENNVTDIRRHHIDHLNRPRDGIALITVETPYEYGTHTNRILLHSAPLLPGILGTISGWGYCFRGDDKGSVNTRVLRSIEVPIMPHRDCVNIYQRFLIQIFDSDLCTFHPQKHCGHIDEGAPLVVDGFLAGLYFWSGPKRLPYNPEYPDVFALLQHSDFNQFITSNIENIEGQSQNHRN